MSAIIRDRFKVRTLLNFINSLNTDSLYLGIGRPQYWDVVTNSDTSISTPINTVKSISEDWNDMIALKRVQFADAYPGIWKEMWQANTIYDAYRHDWDGTRVATYNGPNRVSTTPSSIADVKCFVVTANYTVYVCIKQPFDLNGNPSPSLFSPETGVAVGTNTGIVKTADGYYWKFLAVTSAADLVKFSSKYYHPIETLTVAPAPTDPYYNQWIQQQNSAAFKGGIYTINVLTKGSGYNGGIAGTRAVTDAATDAQFKVIGDGTGLQFTVTYGSGGSIEDVEVTNPGSGYTYATIILENTAGVLADVEVVYSPMTGLGCDPVQDCVARYLLLDVQISGAEGGDFPTSNEYRKVTLVYNPYNVGTTTIATALTLNATTPLTMPVGLNTAIYPADAIVTGATSGAKGRVLDYNTVTGVLRIIRTEDENSGSVGANASFLQGEILNTDAIGQTGVAIVNVGQPEVEKFSGDIIYSEYRGPVARSDNQVDDLKIIVKF